MGPRTSRLVRILHLVAQQPQALEQPQWWLPYGTQTTGQSSLYWGRAMKLVDLREDGSYRLSGRGQMLLAAEPYLEGLNSGFGAPPLLWVLHWWTVSAPCLSQGIDWLMRQPIGEEWQEQKEMLSQMQRSLSKAGEQVSTTVLRVEVKMLLDAYLTQPDSRWETALDCPFKSLGLLRYREIDDLQVGMGTREEKREGRRRQPQASNIKTSRVELGQLRPHNLAIAYAVLDYALDLDKGAQPAGQLKLSKVLYQDWSAPAIRLRFSESRFDQVVDELRQQGQLKGLSLDYLPDADGAVMIWTRPLREMQQEIWRAIIG